MEKLFSGIRLTKIVKLITGRLKKINAAEAKRLPSKETYVQNRIKDALHPSEQRLIITEIKEMGRDVKTFVFAPDGAAGSERVAYFSAGQYICLKAETDGVKISRPYSLSSSPREAMNGKYTVTIKRVDGGLFSQYALDNWSVGAKVTASAPLGVFTYEPLRDASRVVGVAGGSGITPFYSMAKAIADGDEDFSLTLLYGSRTKADVLFGEEFAAIEKATNGKFRVVHVLSEDDSDGGIDGTIEKGFITADLIKKYAPDGEQYSVFMCGPQAMYDFVDKELEKLALRRKFIRHELFGEYRNPSKNSDYPQEAVGKKYKLTVEIKGEEKIVDCDADETLLNAMERSGIAAPSQCRSGVCGYCHSRLIDGKVYVPKSVDGRRLADFDYGYVHPCCTFPLGDVKIAVAADIE